MHFGPQPEREADERFVLLFAQHQLRLRTYIFSLVRDCVDADDVLQEASMALWRKRDSYDPQRDFFAWACGVARIEVLLFRRKRATDRLEFNESLITTLAVEYLEYADDCERRRMALHECLAKLNENDFALMRARYGTEAAVGQIAAQMGRPLSTVYSALMRIRESLFQCVQRSLAQDAHPNRIAE
jgi:RNA polymerase sigma-70 factor, ECF subfamily